MLKRSESPSPLFLRPGKHAATALGNLALMNSSDLAIGATSESPVDIWDIFMGFCGDFRYFMGFFGDFYDDLMNYD